MKYSKITCNVQTPNNTRYTYLYIYIGIYVCIMYASGGFGEYNKI